MDAKDFIDGTVRQLEQELFEEIKDRLVGEYITFSFVEAGKIDLDIFAEKLCDYFEKLELKTGDTFEIILKRYISNWDELVGKRIEKEPATKKNEAAKPVSRARQYYNYIIEIKKSKNIAIKQVVDYSRIMMCLYTSTINQDLTDITDFEYSAEMLSLDKIISSMKAEKPNRMLGIGKKTMFDLTDLYCSDTSTFILLIIMYYFIKNNGVVGEY